MSPEEKNENQASQPEQPKGTGGAAATPAKPSKPAEKPQLETLKEEAVPEGEKKKIDFLYDIELDVNIELGRADLRMRDILSLQPGSVVELNRLAGDPVDIIVNNRLVARGEVIVIDENFAVRVTDILNPAEITASLASSG